MVHWRRFLGKQGAAFCASGVRTWMPSRKLPNEGGGEVLFTRLPLRVNNPHHHPGEASSVVPRTRRERKMITDAERLARIGELLRIRGLIMAACEEQLERIDAADCAVPPRFLPLLMEAKTHERLTR